MNAEVSDVKPTVGQQRLRAEMEGEAVGGNLLVDLVAGGHSGVAGRAYIWSPAFGMGRGFSDTEDVYEEIAKLLDTLENALKRPCVMGSVHFHWDQADQGAMNLNDPRIEPSVPWKYKKQSKTTRAGKRHSQQYSVPGDFED